MSDNVLLNLLDQLGKSDKMQGLPSILSFFSPTSLINSIIQDTQMLDCTYHMTLKLFKNRIFGVKTLRLRHILRNDIMDIIM